MLKLLLRRWRIFIFTGAATSLIITLSYRSQSLQYEAFGLYAAQPTERSNLPPNGSSNDQEAVPFISRVLNTILPNSQTLTPGAQLIKDDELLQDVIQQLDLRDFGGNPASPRSLRKRISLSPHSQAGIIKISLHDPDPNHAQQLVNQLMEGYVAYYSADMPDKSVSFTRVIQPHLVNSDTLYKQTQQALYQIQLGGQGQTPVSTSIRAGDQTPELQAMGIRIQQQLSTIDADLLVLAQILTTASSRQAPLVEQVINLGNVRKELLVQLRETLNQPRDANSLSTLLDQLERKALTLQKELELTQKIYAKFLESEQAPWSITQNSQNPVRVIRAATVSPQGSRPSLPWFLGGGLIASLGAGALVAYIRDKTDHSLASLSEIYEKMQLPIFGIIPHFSGNSLSIQALARHKNSEGQRFAKTIDSYNQVINHLALASLNRIPQVLAFTSITSKEGTSLTVANLAYLLAKQGKKVLLLDANLFQPGQSKYWQVTETAGICECIAGEIQLGKALQRLHHNLDLLRAGHTDKNKHALLNSPGISLLMQEFRTRYDQILVDTSALADSVHGYLLANSADATILILRPGHVHQKHMMHLQEAFDRSGHKFWGMLINDYTSFPRAAKTSKLVAKSQWDATIRLHKQQYKPIDDLEVSTLSAINSHNHALEHEGKPYNKLNLAPHQRREKQEHHLYTMPLDELHKLVGALWEDWEHDVELLLEQEEEVVQQSRNVRDLHAKVERGNPYLKLSSKLELEEEQEKLNLLMEAYVGQRPALIDAKEDLKFYLEILLARTEAEHIPIIKS